LPKAILAIGAADFARIAAAMRRPVIVDGRNLYDPDRVMHAGIRYTGVGRAGGHAVSRESHAAQH
jgi:UDPglucose 6-dehydrogenase